MSRCLSAFLAVHEVISKSSQAAFNSLEHLLHQAATDSNSSDGNWVFLHHTSAMPTEGKKSDESRGPTGDCRKHL